jgi:hypothetical protein
MTKGWPPNIQTQPSIEHNTVRWPLKLHNNWWIVKDYERDGCMSISRLRCICFPVAHLSC